MELTLLDQSSCSLFFSVGFHDMAAVSVTTPVPRFPQSPPSFCTLCVVLSVGLSDVGGFSDGGGGGGGGGGDDDGCGCHGVYSCGGGGGGGGGGERGVNDGEGEE